MITPSHHIPSILLFTSLCLYSFAAHAHDPIPSADHSKLAAQSRHAYEQCLGNAPQSSEKSQLLHEKACREEYALTRLFAPSDLLHMYHKHPHKAEDLYTGRLVAVRGHIHRITKNALGYFEIVFAADDFGLTGVRCTLPKSAEHTLSQLKAGDNITIGGICKGLERDSYVALQHTEIYN